MEMMHGRASIILNGTKIVSEDGATLKIGGISNNVIMVGDTPLNSQKNAASECTCKMPLTAKTNLTEFQKMANVELQFVSDTGKRFVVRAAAQTAELQLGEDGMVEPVFMGAPAIEQ